MDIKSRLILAALFSLSLLTIKGAHRLGRLIGWLQPLFNTNMYKVTRKNIELCYPNLSDKERADLVRKSLTHTGCQMAEAGLAWGGSPQKRQKVLSLVTKETNLALLDDALEKNEGVILLVPHFGNWEFFANYLPQKCKAMVMYKPSKLPVLDARSREARSQSGLIMAPANREGVQKFISHYSKGGVNFILPDQEPSEKSGVWSSFFGVDALTPKFVHYLIKKNPKGKVLIGLMKRVDNGFEVIYNEVDPDIYSNDMDASVAAMNRSFENSINAYGTEQYQWDYKRFKKNPEKFYKSL